MTVRNQSCLGMRRWLVLFGILVGLLLSSHAQAQSRNPFAPAIKVGERVITNYDLDQRTLFLTLLNAGPEAERIARQQLVNEAIQFIAAEREGMSVNEEAVTEAQSNFAAQGNLTREQFIEALGQQGVEEGTFRNFVAAGLVWRDAVRQRFLPQVRVTEADIDRALARTPAEAGVRVLVAEVILPADDPRTERASIARANEIRRRTDFDEFSAAARLFSISPSRFQGGEIGWRPASVLPEPANQEILRLSPGQVTRPTQLGETIAIFQLRDRETVQAGSVEVVSADYAEILIPGAGTERARAEAARIAREARSCDDLFGVLRGSADARISRQTTRINALPAEIARQIAGLDANEISTSRTGDGQLRLVMLCERTLRESAAVDRSTARALLTNQRLEAFAAGYLNELRLALDVEVLR